MTHKEEILALIDRLPMLEQLQFAGRTAHRAYLADIQQPNRGIRTDSEQAAHVAQEQTAILEDLQATLNTLGSK